MHCGTAFANKSATIGLKSKELTTKIHFDLDIVDRVLDEQKETWRITNISYLKIRSNQINFLFEKAKLLKLSKKTAHISALFLDTYFEKSGSRIPFGDNTLVAACSQLLGAKAIELDDKIPFISKLKKYTSVYSDQEQFKKYEVDIALCLDWDMQQVTFYDFVEHFLTKGMVIGEDLVFNKLQTSLSKYEDTNEKVLEFMSRFADSNDQENKPHNLGRGRTLGNALNSKEIMREDCQNIIKSFTRINLKGNGVQELNGLNEDQKEIFLTFFENCVRLIADTLQKCFPIWNYDKKKLAASVILYVRYQVFEGTIAWNLRMEEITELHLGKIRDCFTSICQFFSPDIYKNIEKIQTPLKPITLIGNQGQQQYTNSFKNPQAESEATVEGKSQNNKAQRTDSTNIGTPFIKDPMSNTQNCYPACKTYILSLIHI